MTTPTPGSASPTKRRYQFSIRTLLIVVGVVSILLGLASYKPRQQRETVIQLWRLNGVCYYDGADWSPLRDRIGDLIGPDWLGTIVDVEFRDSSPIGDDDIGVLGNLPAVKSLLFNNCPNITDQGLQRLCTQNLLLEKIYIYNCPQITEAGIIGLSALPRLKHVALDESVETKVLNEHFKSRNITVYYLTYADRSRISN